jgi:uncharacterized protein (TIGR03437 family)
MKSLRYKSGAVIAAILLVIAILKPWRSSGQGDPVPVVAVSAGSYERNAPLAPASIAAAFGERLATRVEVANAQPLPTQLAGTTVLITDSAGVARLAPLFFVSPAQINFLVPADAAVGAATIKVTSGAGSVSSGALRIAGCAPALFSANASGKEAAAALALRVKGAQQSYEPVAEFDAAQNRFVTRPIDLTTAGEEVYLILFGTGVRKCSGVAARAGGLNAPLLSAGAQPDFAGLDQINIGPLPRDLIGRGRVSVAIGATDASASNLVEIEIKGQGGAAPPRIDRHEPAQARAGQEMLIHGAGFDQEKVKNLVRIAGVEAKVTEATAERLSIRVPFGIESGPISVSTPRGEGRSAGSVPVQTSVSGFIEDTRRQPLEGVTVRVRVNNGNIEARTSVEGSFALTMDASVPPALIVEIDPGSLPYPKLLLQAPVIANRDNAFPAPIPLQQTTGPSLTIGPAGNSAARAPASAAQQTGSKLIRTEDIIFEVPGGTTATFPDQSTSGRLTLTAVENSRTPVALPPGFFSSSVAQISPFNVRLNPGAKLTFPNRDSIPKGTAVKLFRIDQDAGSGTIGSFVEVNTLAVVSEDGQRIETAPNAIKDTSIYFVAAQRFTTTVAGRIVESDGVTPVRLARVRARGQEALTDGNGGFAIRNVFANQGATIVVDASFQRSNGVIDRMEPVSLIAVVGGITDIGTRRLPAEGGNRPPTIQAVASLDMNVNEMRTIPIAVNDPDPGQTVEVFVSKGLSFVTLTQTGPNLYQLKLSPVKNTDRNDAGRDILTITARDNEGASRTHDIALRVNQPPSADPQSVSLNEDSSVRITLMGRDPDDAQISFIIASNPKLGALAGSAPNLTYTPRRDENGSDSFTFKTTDGTGESGETTVSIAILPQNDAPAIFIRNDQYRLETQGGLSFTVEASDVDGDTLTLSARGRPNGAIFPDVTGRGAATGQFSWTPGSAQFGGYTVTFDAKDGAATASQTVAISVTPRWSQTQGLEGGQVFAFLNQGANLLAGGAGGVYLSANQGQSWTPVNNGLTNTQVLSLASTGARLFAGTDGAGVFVSTNQGQSWTQVNDGFLNRPENLQARSLTHAGGALFVGTDGGVFRSTNEGQSWTAMNNGIPPNTTVFAFAVSGSNLFAGASRGVFRSTDQGQSWTQVNNGLTSLIVRALLVSGSNLLAGTFTEGVFVSGNDGQSWAQANSGLTAKTILSLSASGASIFAGTSGGGVFVTSNQGQNWAQVNTGLTNIFINALAPNSTSLFAGTNGGVFRSANLGQSWGAANTGLRAVTVLSLASLNNNLFVGTGGDGPYLTINQGQSWLPANADLLNLVVPAFAIVNNRLYAGTEGGVFYTDNNGVNWPHANNGLLEARYVNALAANSSVLYAGTGPINGVFRSENLGLSWTQANNGITNPDIRALAMIGNSVFAGTEKAGIFRSTNLGQNWEPVNNGLPRCEYLRGDIRVHALHPSGMTLFAGTCDGVYRSSDQGQNWQRVSSGLPPTAFVNAIIEKNDALFIGIFGGIYMSANHLASNSGEVKWNLANTGLLHTNVYSFAPAGSNLAAGTIGGGVYFSR